MLGAIAHSLSHTHVRLSNLCASWEQQCETLFGAAANQYLHIYSAAEHQEKLIPEGKTAPRGVRHAKQKPSTHVARPIHEQKGPLGD